MKRNKSKRAARQANDVRRAAREVIGEPSRGRKRGPHRVREPQEPDADKDYGSDFCPNCIYDFGGVVDIYCDKHAKEEL